MINIILYIDPGSGMIIVQLLISIFAGIALFFKRIKNKIKSIISNIKERFKKS